MTEGLWAAIIGVGGTLLGPALGWWLNTLSNRGKIDIFCKKWDVEFEINNKGFIVKTDDIEKAECLILSGGIEILNVTSSASMVLSTIIPTLSL